MRQMSTTPEGRHELVKIFRCWNVSFFSKHFHLSLMWLEEQITENWFALFFRLDDSLIRPTVSQKDIANFFLVISNYISFIVMHSGINVVCCILWPMNSVVLLGFKTSNFDFHFRKIWKNYTPIRKLEQSIISQSGELAWKFSKFPERSSRFIDSGYDV